MKLLAIYVGIGAAWQLVMWWYGRWKYGRAANDVVMRIALGRFAVLKALIACALWPLGMALYFFQSKQSARRMWAREIDQFRDEMADRCPDCGELINGHAHEAH